MTGLAGLSNCQLPNYRIVELPNCRIIKLPNYRIIELPNCRIAELPPSTLFPTFNLNFTTLDKKYCHYNKKHGAGSLNQEVYDIHRQLVEACKAGDRKAYNEIYNSYSKAMYNISYRMMNNAEDARDMLQEGFIDAFRRIESFRFDSTFGAWLKKIVINKCINALEKRRIVWEDTEIVDENTSDNDNESINEEELQLSVEKVKKAMNRLPEGARVIFSLYLLEGYDHTEISEILHISESTSKTQFMRARQMVKEFILAMPAV